MRVAPPSNRNITTSPMDLFHILQRRKVSLIRWCQEHGIHSVEQFQKKKHELESRGEFMISEAMVQAVMVLLPVPVPPPEPSVEPEPVSPEEQDSSLSLPGEDQSSSSSSLAPKRGRVSKKVQPTQD